MRFGSLFSGIGGFDLGLDRAGMECAWQVEIEPTCISVLSQHWPSVRRYEDVTKIQEGDLEPVDLICGGFPCQDISVAGRRAGLAGERSGLWFEFYRILATLRPRWLVIENVDGLRSSGEPSGEDLAVILRGLANLGYLGAYRVLDAQYFGLAQRRERVFIVGSLGNASGAAVLLESESLRGDSPPRRKTREAVAATIRGGSAGGSTHGKPSGTDRGPFAIGESPAGLTRKDIADGTLSRALGRVGGGDDPGANKGAPIVADENSGQSAGGGPFAIDVRNLRLEPDQTSGTLQAKKTGGYSLNYQNPVVVPDDAQPADPFIYQHASGGGDDPKDTAQALRSEAEHSYQVVYDARGNGAQVDDEVAQPLQASDARLSNQIAGVIGGGNAGSGRRSEDDPNLVIDDAPPEDPERIAGAVTSKWAKQSGGPAGDEAYNLVAPPLTSANDPSRSPQSQEVTGQVEVLTAVAGHPRRLTPRECERLQGFPDDWTDVPHNGRRMSDSARYRMLGNAVAVPVAEWLGRRIMAEEQRRE